MHEIRHPVGAVLQTKPRYSAQDFVDTLTEAEFEELVNLAKTNRKAAAAWERIKVKGLDMADPKDNKLVDQLSTAGVITQERKQVIKG